MYKWKPSKAAREAFGAQMREIETFCRENNISRSLSRDSYYFTLDGKDYRVSNHSVEASNAGAYDWTGEKVRELYHEGGRNKNTIYIHAGKTRIIEIFNNLKAGKSLDGRGNVIEGVRT